MTTLQKRQMTVLSMNLCYLFFIVGVSGSDTMILHHDRLHPESVSENKTFFRLVWPVVAHNKKKNEWYSEK